MTVSPLTRMCFILVRPQGRGGVRDVFRLFRFLSVLYALAVAKLDRLARNVHFISGSRAMRLRGMVMKGWSASP